MINFSSFNINNSLVERVISRQVSCIIPVHLFYSSRFNDLSDVTSAGIISYSTPNIPPIIRPHSHRTNEKEMQETYYHSIHSQLKAK